MWQTFLTVFGSVLIAELGDKTQLAAFLFASDKSSSKWVVFAGASLALMCACAVAVMAGHFLSQCVNEKHLRYAAGVCFLFMGLFTILKA